jgi:hypothetical protein
MRWQYKIFVEFGLASVFSVLVFDWGGCLCRGSIFGFAGLT